MLFADGRQRKGELPLVASACALTFAMFSWYMASVASLDLTGGIGFALDDGWIHLAFARNLANDGAWAFNPGQTSGGVSSILYVFCLAFGLLLTDSGQVVAYAWNFVTLLAVAGLSAGVALELARGCRKSALFMLLLVVACGNLIWFAFTGMETLLLLALSLAAIRASRANNRLLTAVLIVLAALTRPEGITVAAAIAIWHWFYPYPQDAAGRRLRMWQVALAAMVGALAINCMWQYVISGDPLPSTVVGRRWISGVGEHASLNPVTIMKNFAFIVGVWGYRLMNFTFGQALLMRLPLPSVVCWFVAGLGALVAAIGFCVYLVWMRAMAGMLLLWAILHTFAYAVMLPGRGHGGRYQPMVPILAMMCFALGVMFLFGRIGKYRWIIAPLVVVVLGSTYTWKDVTTQSISHFDKVHVSAGMYLHENTPPDAVVAAFDIGAIGYFSQRNIVDIAGLLDGKAGIALYEGKMPAYLAEKQPDYLAMIYPYTDPDAYWRLLKLDEWAKTVKLTLEKEFSVPIGEYYLPGEAARVLAYKIKIFRVESRQ